ncbi:MAG TPA: hypothetical protein VF548_05835 [Allosphingosinicella sp.]|jgi:hypothetical protein
MQGIIIDSIAIIVTCLLVAGAAVAMIVFRPWKRRRRHRRRHSHQPRIDLFEAQPAEPSAKLDA